jgi:metallo-beta-lactamase class B
MMTMGAGKADDVLTRPIAPESAKRWLAPQPPVRLHGRTYLVGFGGLNVALIRTSAGLILIDGAVPQAVEDIEAKMRALGFSIKQVKLILSTEPHFDHAGGIAALARDSRATVVASGPAAAVLRQGGGDPDDPQAAWLERFPAVTKLRVARDGEVIRLGDTAITAHATPGHTLGSMSWSWKSCEGKDCRTIVFAASLNPIAVEGWRFADPGHRRFVDAFRASFARVKAMRCDMLIASHPLDGDAGRVARLMKARTPNPFIDPGACRRYAERAEAALGKKLAE